MKKPLLILFISLFLSCNSIDNKNPNIVLFFVDDLGWTDLSFMGSKYYETPNIDNLSKSGMTFYNCLLYTSPSPRDRTRSRMPSSA